MAEDIEKKPRAVRRTARRLITIVAVLAVLPLPVRADHVAEASVAQAGAAGLSVTLRVEITPTGQCCDGTFKWATGDGANGAIPDGIVDGQYAGDANGMAALTDGRPVSWSRTKPGPVRIDVTYPYRLHGAGRYVVEWEECCRPDFSKITGRLVALLAPSEPVPVSARRSPPARTLLTWGAPLVNSGDVIGYRVLRGTGGAMSVVADLAGADHAFVDEGLDGSTDYYYSVQARAAIGDGLPSSALLAERTANPGTHTNSDGSTTLFDDRDGDGSVDGGEGLATVPAPPRVPNLKVQQAADGSIVIYDDRNNNGQRDDGETVIGTPATPNRPGIRVNADGSATVYDDRDGNGSQGNGEPDIANTPPMGLIVPTGRRVSEECAGGTAVRDEPVAGGYLKIIARVVGSETWICARFDGHGQHTGGKLVVSTSATLPTAPSPPPPPAHDQMWSACRGRPGNITVADPSIGDPSNPRASFRMDVSFGQDIWVCVRAQAEAIEAPVRLILPGSDPPDPSLPSGSFVTFHPDAPGAKLPPKTPSLLAPAPNGAFTPGMSQRFSIRTNDPDVDDYRGIITVREATYGSIVAALTTAQVNSGETASATAAPALGSGRYVWSARAEDSDGMSSAETGLRPFSVDRAPNVPTLVSPAPGASMPEGEEQSFSVTATDPDGDSWAAEVTIRDENDNVWFRLMSTSVASGATATVTPPWPLPGGRYSWTASAIDAWGARSAVSEARTVWVDLRNSDKCSFYKIASGREPIGDPLPVRIEPFYVAEGEVLDLDDDDLTAELLLCVRVDYGGTNFGGALYASVWAPWVEPDVSSARTDVCKETVMTQTSPFPLTVRVSRDPPYAVCVFAEGEWNSLTFRARIWQADATAEWWPDKGSPELP